MFNLPPPPYNSDEFVEWKTWYQEIYRYLSGPVNKSVASTATITLPRYGNIFTITGTTNITSITATNRSGSLVVLVFAGALTVTDGSNLNLAGNFVTTANDTLTLMCDGVNWNEVSRSVN